MQNRIRIKLGPIEFEAEGDSELIQREREQFFSLLPQAIPVVSSVVIEGSRMLEAVTDGKEIQDSPEISALPASNVSRSYESVVSFLNEKSFANDSDIVMGVAYYIDCINNDGPFTSKDIENKLSEARQAKPSNIAHCINLNIKKGFIREISTKKDGKKAYQVLSDGIKWCEEYTASENGGKKKTNKTKQKCVESPLLSISLEELNLDNYCDVSALEKIDEQILVIIWIYTKERNIEYFSFDDIVSILKNKFKIPVTMRQVQYFFEKTGTKFDKKVEKKRAYHKLMQNGIREAEEIGMK